MPYSTPGEVRAAVSPVGVLETQPTAATGTAADLTNEQLADAIAEADATIDSYLGGRYQTPLPNDPSTGKATHPVDWWSRNIAAYNATLSFRASQDFSDNDPVARRYNATIKALEAVRDGKQSMPGDAFPELTNADSSQVEGAGAPFNAYDGVMFTPGDFSLAVTNTDTPRWWSGGLSW